MLTLYSRSPGQAWQAGYHAGYHGLPRYSLPPGIDPTAFDRGWREGAADRRTPAAHNPEPSHA